MLSGSQGAENLGNAEKYKVAHPHYSDLYRPSNLGDDSGSSTASPVQV